MSFTALKYFGLLLIFANIIWLVLTFRQQVSIDKIFNISISMANIIYFGLELLPVQEGDEN